MVPLLYKSRGKGVHTAVGVTAFLGLWKRPEVGQAPRHSPEDLTMLNVHSGMKYNFFFKYIHCNTLLIRKKWFSFHFFLKECFKCPPLCSPTYHTGEAPSLISRVQDGSKSSQLSGIPSCEGDTTVGLQWQALVCWDGAMSQRVTGVGRYWKPLSIRGTKEATLQANLVEARA